MMAAAYITLPPQIRERISVEGECWLWIGPVDTQRGYGRMFSRQNGRKTYDYAHRLVYRLARGPIVNGDLHHYREGCPKRCVNPWHLQDLTRAEHAALHARQIVACKRGHDLTNPANVWVCADGSRTCKACQLVTRAARVARCDEAGHPARPGSSRCMCGNRHQAGAA